MKNISEFLELPKSCFINSRIPKNTFTNNLEFQLKREEKALLKEEIDSIYLMYSLKPAWLNISKYEDDDVRYEEIEILKVKINNENKYVKVCELLQKYIQYPILVIIEQENNIKINAAIKKINKVDRSKLIVEEMIYTEWINLDELNSKESLFIQSLSISNFNTNNLFLLYDDYVNRIKSYITLRYSDEFKVKSKDEVINDSKILERIDNLENEVILLKKNIKKETNMASKVEVNIKIKEIQREIESLKNTLSWEK